MQSFLSVTPTGPAVALQLSYVQSCGQRSPRSLAVLRRCRRTRGRRRRRHRGAAADSPFAADAARRAVVRVRAARAHRAARELPSRVLRARAPRRPRHAARLDAGDRVGPHRGHAALGHPARRARAGSAARHQRGALPDSAARAGGCRAARERARRRARPSGARAAHRDAQRAARHRRARARRGDRAAAVRPRSAVAGFPDRHAAERRAAALRSSRGRDRDGSRRARADSGPSAQCRGVPPSDSLAAERSPRAFAARRRTAARPAVAHLALARAAGRRPARVRVGARSDGGVRGSRRRRFDVRRRTGGARDVPVALQRVVARRAAGAFARADGGIFGRVVARRHRLDPRATATGLRASRATATGLRASRATATGL